MIEFFKALYSACSSSAFYTSIGGRFAYGEASQAWAYPYGVYFGVTMAPEDTFTEGIEDTSFQVNLYSETRTEAMQIGQSCSDFFDKMTLTSTTGYKDNYIKKTLMTPPWKNGDVWIVSVEFETLLQAEA